MGTKTFAVTRGMETVGSGILVFACPIKLYSVYGDEKRFISFDLKWEVYINNFGRVKTVCFAKFRDKNFVNINRNTTDELQFSSFACLHPRHPEEFCVSFGIKKTFARLVTTLQANETLRDLCVVSSGKNWRRAMWGQFDTWFEHGFSSDIFRFLKEDGSIIYVQFDVSSIREALKRKVAVWEIEVGDG